MNIVYMIWGLLPFALFALTARAMAKKVLKRPGREYAQDYVKQAVFCSVVLAVAIVIDKYWADDLLGSIPLGDADPRIFKWLLYPALLGVVAYIQHIFDKKKQDQERAERDERQRRFSQRQF